MTAMIQGYLKRCEKTESEPDTSMLQPIQIALKSLAEQQENTP
jgi:hypothetical protein